MKIKDEKQKHNHKLTDLIKVGIFAILMIAPLLASVSQMLYVTVNKNAKDSYYGETINQSEDIFINTSNEIQINTWYQFTPNDQTLNINLGETTNHFYCDKVIWNDTEYQNMRLGFYNSPSGTSSIPYLYIRNSQGTNLSSIPFNNNNITNVKFTITNFTGITNDLLSFIKMYTIQYNKYSYLDNAFYYGVDQMTKSDLFNWTQNTAIYTGVKAMTDNLQIQTPAIAILIVYWFILTIIYVIIDIVLKCFTTITHMIFRAD